MRQAWWPGAVAAFLLTISGFSSAAEEKAPPAPGSGHTYVVLVGSGTYTDPVIKARPVAEQDAQALYDTFTDAKYLGVPADHIKLFLGSADAKRNAQSATKANILAAVKWVVDSAKKDDLVIFALLGQGASAGDRTCFFTHDSKFTERTKTAVLAADIELALEKLKSQRLVALVDVSYKGYDPGKEKVAEPNLLDIVRVFVGPEDKEEHQLPPGRVIFLSNVGTAAPLALDKGTAFGKVILDGLHGQADKDGYEADGWVTVDELMTHLETELPALARKTGKTKEEKEQAPLVWGGRSSHFEVTHNPAAYPQAQERLAKLKKLVDAKKIDAELADEGNKLLSRMPKLKAQQELRKGYQALVDDKLTTDAFVAKRKEINASTVLSTRAAESYATKTLRAIATVKKDYVKDLDTTEMVTWAIRGLHRRLEEKLPGDVKDELDAAKQLKGQEQIAKLKQILVGVRSKLGVREDLDNDKDVDLSVQMMMTNLDPYTNYIDKEAVKRFEQDMGGNFSGIGVQIRRDPVRDALLVVTPIKDSPAYKKGLKAGDFILEIIREVDPEGKPLKDEKEKRISTQGMKTEEAVKLILGKPGTPVTIVFERDGKKQEVEITRGRVETESVLGVNRKKDDTWDFVLDRENKIGYIRLLQFQRNSAKDMEKAVLELAKKEKIKGLVLDLRFNPGGLLTAAVSISDLFIDDGLIVSIRPRVGQEAAYSGEHEGSQLGFPMACLVNGGSASGSEIVSACLQDHKRAIIVGERSYGKGSVQNILDFGDTSAKIKLTTASFWRPNGKNLNKSSTKGEETEDWGVRPDPGYLVKLTPAEQAALRDHLRDVEIIATEKDKESKDKKKDDKPFEDKQLNKALDYLRDQIKVANKASKAQ
jgi:C-terminal peptidase prc